MRSRVILVGWIDPSDDIYFWALKHPLIVYCVVWGASRLKIEKMGERSWTSRSADGCQGDHWYLRKEEIGALLAIFKLILTDGNYEPPRKNFPFIWSKIGGNRLVSPSFGQKTMSPKKVVRRPVKVPLRRGWGTSLLLSLFFCQGKWKKLN